MGALSISEKEKTFPLTINVVDKDALILLPKLNIWSKTPKVHKTCFYLFTRIFAYTTVDRTYSVSVVTIGD